MTGLDKIITQISADTNRICDEIRNESEKHCSDIISYAVTESDKLKEKCENDIEKTKIDFLSRAQSSAKLEKRSIMLEVKQQILKDVLKKSLDYICSMPSDDYFELVLNMVSKYSEKEKGEIYFSRNDLSRLPADFKKRINTVSKGELIISEAFSDVDYGFVLKYGKVEINCVFSALFSSYSDEFIDAVSALLFLQEDSVEYCK